MVAVSIVITTFNVMEDKDLEVKPRHTEGNGEGGGSKAGFLPEYLSLTTTVYFLFYAAHGASTFAI